MVTVAEAVERSRKRWPEGPVSPEVAALVRPLCTALRMHLDCPRRACRRARACAAADVPCFRQNRDELQPIAASLYARHWQMRCAEGHDNPLGPTWTEDKLRRIAFETREIPRILAGEYGDDDALTPYQLWLKYWIAPLEEAIMVEANSGDASPSAAPTPPASGADATPGVRSGG